MLTHLIALGLFATADSGGTSETGEIIATAERTVLLATVQTASLVTTSIPLGASTWRQQFDPADHAPYAIDFSALLAVDEKIAEVQAITMSATAALLGVGVDTSTDYQPVIEAAAGKKVQIWFVVDEDAWQAAAFNALGVVLPITVRILTDAIPPKRFERTVALTVRQL